MTVWTFRGPQEPFSSDEEGGADKENMQYAVLSCTRLLVEKSEEVLQVLLLTGSLGTLRAIFRRSRIPSSLCKLSKLR